jgi:hypothetical protein
MTDGYNDRVITVTGAYESHSGTDQQYATVCVQDLMTMERTAVPKDQAQWVLCSTYNEPDARSHKAQEKHGRFVMVAIDLDGGNIQGKALVQSVQSFTGQVQMRVYSSSSATAEARKWRVLIPTLDAMQYDEWVALTVALNKHIESQIGIRPDRALERAGQPIYLPNTAPRADGIEPLIADNVLDGQRLNWRECSGSELVLQMMMEEEERAKEHEQRSQQARRKMAQMRARPDTDKSVIQQFNEAHALDDILVTCGYRAGPRGGWKSPRQSTDSYATKVFNEPAGSYWVSLSGSDLEAGVGNKTQDGRSCFGDAFDLFAFHMHSNDRSAAIKAAANDLGIKAAPSQADTLADMGRRLNTAKALQVLTGGALTQINHVPDAGQMVESAPLTEFDEGYKAPLALVDIPATEGVQLLSFVQASNLPDWKPPQELIEGVLIERTMSVVYGDSNTGKSFLVLDMAAHISLGLPWFGKRVKRGAVLYLAAEAPRSIQDRSRALAQKLNTSLDNLFITDCPIDLYDANGDAMAIVNTIKAIEQHYGVEIMLIVVDTLARAIGGGDENATKDMGLLVKHSDLIKANTRAHIMFVHHTGKDQTRGARGSSALRAATDTEIEVSDAGKGGPKEFKVTKQRDLDGKGEVYAFVLIKINLGLGVFDNLMTTCYVEQAQPSQVDDAANLKDGEREILDLIRDSGTGGLRYMQLVETVESVSKPTAKRYIGGLKAKGFIYEQSGQLRLGDGKANFGNRVAEF